MQKSAISNAQCDNKQQANSTTAQSHDNTNHSVTDTLPIYASNSVPHAPTETALPLGESTSLLKSLLSLSLRLLVILVMSMLPAAIISTLQR